MADDDLFVDINLDEVEEGGNPLPEAVYEVRVATVEKKQKEGGKYPYFKVTLNPTQEPHQKRKLWLNLSTHPDALWNLKRFVKACGLEFGKAGFSMAGIREKKVAVTVKVTENEDGEPRNEVSSPYHKVA